MITVWGLVNCDSCRKARKWLDAGGADYRFVDIRETPPDRATLQRWLDAVGAERLVNRRSTTWRALDADTRAAILAAPDERLPEHPTLVKRPLLDVGRAVAVGFDATVWQGLMD